MKDYHFASRREHLFSNSVIWRNIFFSFLTWTTYAAAIFPKTPSNFRVRYDSNGRSLCPIIDCPSVSFSSSQLAIAFPTSPVHIPGEIQCAWKCTNDLNCTCFNWKGQSGQCELYYYTPANCSYSCGCLHFEVSRSAAHKLVFF